MGVVFLSSSRKSNWEVFQRFNTYHLILGLLGVHLIFLHLELEALPALLYRAAQPHAKAL